MAIGFSIPGNVKQCMLPFVIDPNKSLNRADKEIGNRFGDAGRTDPAAVPQWFSFKSFIQSDNSGRIQLWPSTLTDNRYGMFYKKDISYKLVYAPEFEHVVKKQTRLDIDTLLDQLPAVQIREFLPDTQFDQLTNLVSDLFSVIGDAFGGIDYGTALKSMLTGGLEFLKRMAEKIKGILEAAYDFITSKDKENSLLYLKGKLRDVFAGNPQGLTEAAADLYGKLVSFPFAMYYRLQSYTTTNVYELPAMLQDKTLISSNGKAGWEGGAGIGLTDVFGKDSFMTKIPLFGKVIQQVTKGIKVNWMPLWDSDKGSAAQHPAVKLQFDLFNDTAEAAMMNFIFVNTVVPNNMYVQHGMFQHSSSLYDVRIEGFDRMFACSGNFQVEQLGVLRVPSWDWVSTFLVRHYNWKDRNGDFPDIGQFMYQVFSDRLIKIPDVYRVTMDFESLLPNNFNSYLFNYLKNDKMERAYSDAKNTVQLSIFQQKFFEDLKTDFAEKLKAKTDEMNEEMEKIQVEMEEKAAKKREEERKRKKAARDAAKNK